MRVLIIDDYRPHGESLRELLEVRGHEVLYAESYDEARGHLEVIRFDLAFLDFDMPKARGPALAARLASRFPMLRSVIVSAHLPIGARKEELGDLPFLQKPVSVPALVDCLARIERDIVGSPLIVRVPFPVAAYRRAELLSPTRATQVPPVAQGAVTRADWASEARQTSQASQDLQTPEGPTPVKGPRPPEGLGKG